VVDACVENRVVRKVLRVLAEDLLAQPRLVSGCSLCLRVSVAQARGSQDEVDCRRPPSATAFRIARSSSDAAAAGGTGAALDDPGSPGADRPMEDCGLSSSGALQPTKNFRRPSTIKSGLAPGQAWSLKLWQSRRSSPCGGSRRAYGLGNVKPEQKLHPDTHSPGNAEDAATDGGAD